MAGTCGHLLRRWDEAASQLEACLAALRTGFPREAGVALTALAEVCVERGDLDRAEELGRQALDIAQLFGSARGLIALAAYCAACVGLLQTLRQPVDWRAVEARPAHPAL
jgi:hypothetical protein